jgi:hypothetical protein
MSWTLTVVWFIFRNGLHFVLCVREKLEKRREIGIIFKTSEEKGRDIKVGLAAILRRNVIENQHFPVSLYVFTLDFQII